MSGDLGSEVVVRAAYAALQKYSNIELVLVGDQDELDELVMRIVGDESRLRIVHASQIVTMDDPPADSIRKKKDSSMRVAINLVKSGEVQACVSAGNTGALMATAKFVLKMLPGIDRPAIIAELPSTVGTMHMLDIGANTVCTADHLFQFAVMGSIVTADVAKIEAPRIALLNIGAEDTKGHESIRDAAAMLIALPAAAFLFVLPMMSIHRRLVHSRDEYVEEMNRQIAAASRELAFESIQKLELLMQHRDRIGDISTWPLDWTIYSRLAFYVILPPIAWLGAAFVEFGVDRILGSP